MHRARSRLQIISSETPIKKHRSEAIHFRYWPLAIVSLPFFGLIGFMMTHVRPSVIQDMLLPNTYLPLLSCVFLAVWFLSCFLLQNIRWGALLSALISLFLFLKLQSVIFTPSLIAALLISFAIIELLLTVVSKKKHANLS